MQVVLRRKTSSAGMVMIIRAILILLLAFIAQPAGAVTNYGKWLCTDCVVETLPTNVAIPAAGELAAFIKAQVNQAVNSHIWRANDYVTICDGAQCVTLFYHSSGVHMPAGPPFPDNRVGYRNVGSGANVTSQPSGSFGDMDITVSWRLVDVYILDHGTGSEAYLGSYYEITGISVNGNPVKPIKTIPQ